MIYELFDTATANQVGVYQTEDAALAAVRGAVHRHGDDSVTTLALGLEDEAGDTTVIASGAALARLAAAHGDGTVPLPSVMAGAPGRYQANDD